jgi:hypothetical protein
LNHPSYCTIATCDIEVINAARGIDEYMMLTVGQTCKYSGVDYLDFLLYGEKDIAAFASPPGTLKTGKTLPDEIPLLSLNE